MFPLLLGLGPSELLIILAIVLLLFGGSRLAGLGKSTGRAIKEFKEETKDIKGQSRATDVNDPKPVEGQQVRPAADPVHEDDGVHEAEIIDPEHKKGL